MFVNTEDEKGSDTEDCHTNLFQTKLKVNPALFRKSGKHTKSSLKEINELKAMLCKVVATENKGKDFLVKVKPNSNFL